MPSCPQRPARQVPGEEAHDDYDQLLATGGDNRKECFWIGFHVTMEHNRTVMVEDIGTPRHRGFPHSRRAREETIPMSDPLATYLVVTNLLRHCRD
jgi:hypothetical protein